MMPRQPPTYYFNCKKLYPSSQTRRKIEGMQECVKNSTPEISFHHEHHFQQSHLHTPTAPSLADHKENCFQTTTQMNP
jgi:hypothetical protein